MQPESLMMTAGYDKEWSQGAIKCPIFQTSTFVFNKAEEGKAFFEVAYGLREKDAAENVGLIYSRLNNPNVEILEDRLKIWDAAEDCACFNSGMSAISTVFFEFLKPGSLFVYSAPIYGGTHHFIQHVLTAFGIEGIPFGPNDTKDDILQKINTHPLKDHMKMIYVETPANPTNHLFSLTMCSDIAKGLSSDDNKVLLVVDNTYMGPIWQHPIELGADLVIYSATKYIAGHSDLIAGAVSGSKQLIQRVKVLRTFFGNLPSPNTAWLLMRSLETMKIRMEQQQANAKLIAQYLCKHPKVAKVYYLGLLEKGTAQWDIFNEQCKGEGAMLSFDIKGGEKEAFAFLNHLKLIQLAVSLGSTESLAEHPATMTHIDIPENEKKIMNITSALVRLSVGVENADDLIADIERALEKV
jgi:methionine-gamma-lyase